MSREKNFYKKLWAWVIGIVILALIIVIPFIINESYKVKSRYVTMWGANDVLAFYGSLLSFVGTVVLGALALFQNIKANEINKRLTSLENERFKLELRPFVLVTSWKIEPAKVSEILSPKKLYFQIENTELDGKECLCLSLFFTNTSNSVVLVNYTGAEVSSSGNVVDKWSCSTSNQQNTKLYLQNGETGEIGFYCSKDKMESFIGKNIRLELTLENRFSEKYKETLDIIILQLLKINDRWHLYISPQNYQIKKFIRDENGKTVLQDE
ncbi:MAG: hypothetical protein BWY74_03534 [Firmicutes bacterium ADurb.Bin419]|nr:MAG: hypothetical protein BWY74_03534 [Firmicutes bacterium ADurb.Bin419]